MKETKILKNNEVLTNLVKETVERWKIIDYSERNNFNCQHPLKEYSSNCGEIGKLAWLVNLDSNKEKWICRQHLPNYQLVKEDEVLADKDKTISQLKEKITDLEKQNNDLDYLLNSGRNKFEHERNKRLKELETKLYQLLTNQEFLKEPVILFDEYERKDNSKLTKISGILTSQIRSKASSNTPYMAFIRKVRECQQHPIEECQRIKCQECEMPVVFRITNETHLDHLSGAFTCNFKHRELGETHWQKPNLKKGVKVLLQGSWAKSDHSPRPSFTAYSYQIIDHE